MMTFWDSHLKGKKSLDTVGSIKTIQAIGPYCPTLSAKEIQNTGDINIDIKHFNAFIVTYFVSNLAMPVSPE